MPFGTARAVADDPLEEPAEAVGVAGEAGRVGPERAVHAGDEDGVREGDGDVDLADGQDGGGPLEPLRRHELDPVDPAERPGEEGVDADVADAVGGDREPGVARREPEPARDGDAVGVVGPRGPPRRARPAGAEVLASAR